MCKRQGNSQKVPSLLVITQVHKGDITIAFSIFQKRKSRHREVIELGPQQLSQWLPGVARTLVSSGNSPFWHRNKCFLWDHAFYFSVRAFCVCVHWQSMVLWVWKLLRVISLLILFMCLLFLFILFISPFNLCTTEFYSAGQDLFCCFLTSWSGCWVN